MAVNESLADADGIAAALWDLAQLEMYRQNFAAAFEPLAKSYAIFQRTGRLDGICMVGLYLGQFLCGRGQRDQGLQVLTRSRDGFRQLGQMGLAEQAQTLIDRVQASS